MALDFPDSPTVGQIFDQWQWDGAKWIAAPSSVGVDVGDNLPDSPTVGSLYWDLPTAKLFIWDGTQWVVTINTPEGGANIGYLPLFGSPPNMYGPITFLPAGAVQPVMNLDFSGPGGGGELTLQAPDTNVNWFKSLLYPSGLEIYGANYGWPWIWVRTGLGGNDPYSDIYMVDQYGNDSVELCTGTSILPSGLGLSTRGPPGSVGTSWWTIAAVDGTLKFCTGGSPHSFGSAAQEVLAILDTAGNLTVAGAVTENAGPLPPP